MQIYADIDRDSGVMGFEIEDTSITVYFKGTSRPYIYSYRKAGIQGRGCLAETQHERK